MRNFLKLLPPNHKQHMHPLHMCFHIVSHILLGQCQWLLTFSFHLTMSWAFVALTDWSAFGSPERELLSLPACLGELGINIPSVHFSSFFVFKPCCSSISWPWKFTFVPWMFIFNVQVHAWSSGLSPQWSICSSRLALWSTDSTFVLCLQSKVRRVGYQRSPLGLPYAKGCFAMFCV